MLQVVKEVKFLAVARRSDKSILAHRIHTSDKSYDFIANVQKGEAAPGLRRSDTLASCCARR